MKLLRSATAPPSEASVDKLVRLFQSETAEIEDAPEPGTVHNALLVFAVMLATMIAIAMLMPIDRVVSSVSGKVVTVEPTIVLGAFDQSIIRSLDVKAGERVKKGQLLATLDSTITHADVKTLQTQIASDDAEIARCQAELAQTPYVPLPADGRFGAQQKAYYDERKAEYDAQLRAYDEQIGQLKAALVKFQTDMTRYGDRDRIARRIEQMRQQLAAAQVGSQLNLLVAQDQQMEMLRNVDYDRNAVAEAQHQLLGATATRQAFIEKWFAGVSYELLNTAKDRDNARQQLAKAELHQGLVRLTAPRDAVVLSIAKLSVGSVLTAGTPLLDLAPLGSAMEVELRISTNEVGFIRVGDQTTIRFDAFDPAEHGTAKGKVRSISDGAFDRDDNDQPVPPYYKVRVALTDVHLHAVPRDFRLIPGMTLTGDIHVGHHSLMMFLTHGIINGFSEAMRQP
ncbi:MAG TPA: HlyD family type I secretion periplasmic adaptor subunit [Stellaceae bacterium]|nr:HlyD family type I secretion periplasmic adaptor subunit [Stellaceae bacterium]